MEILHTLFVLGAIFYWETQAVPNQQRDDSTESIHWALLVAGSQSWMNYRHQADICHAYQVVHKHGISDDHVVVMMYDDIAYNSENPTQGVIINRPNGPNVYTGVPKDYNGKDVTPENFLNVLQGNTAAMKGIGSGKVIASGPNDNVFVYFADHGATNLIAFPDETLSMEKLKEALENMSAKKKFNKLVFYLEACESGSMFNSYTLPKVFVTTAAGPNESSYAYYYDKTLETYLGDEYSVRWMENSDTANLAVETLLKQFHLVKKETKQSTVHKYGDMSIDGDPLQNYQGGRSKVKDVNATDLPNIQYQMDGVPSPEVSMAILHHRLMAAKDSRQQSKILQQISELSEAQHKMVSILETTVSKVLNGNQTLVDKMMKRHDIHVTNWDCYQGTVKYFSKNCFPFSKYDYALSLMYILANLCEAQVPTQMILAALGSQCL